KRVPPIMVAHKKLLEGEEYNSGVGGYKGQYDGGVYKSAPARDAAATGFTNVHGDNNNYNNVASQRKPQMVYYENLILGFRRLQSKLSIKPPEMTARKLGVD